MFFWKIKKNTNISSEMVVNKLLNNFYLIKINQTISELCKFNQLRQVILPIMIKFAFDINQIAIQIHQTKSTTNTNHNSRQIGKRRNNFSHQVFFLNSCLDCMCFPIIIYSNMVWFISISYWGSYTLEILVSYIKALQKRAI